MAKQNTFISEEWALLRLAPSLVSAGTAAADPSGIVASIKEAAAGAGVVADAFKANGGLEQNGIRPHGHRPIRFKLAGKDRHRPVVARRVSEERPF